MMTRPLSRRLYKNRWFRITSAVCLTLAAILVAACAYFRIYTPRDIIAYLNMNECNPIWKDLALRRLRKGDPVEKAIELSQPSEIVTTGRRSRLIYNSNYLDAEWGIPFTGLSITTEDGRIVSAIAWSCTWYHVFFGDERELNALDQEVSPLPSVHTHFTPDGSRASSITRPASSSR